MINPRILVLDVDGVVNSTPLAGMTRNPFISGILAMPFVKQLAMGTIETGESLLRIKYKTEVRFVRDKRHDVEYMGIITDRSARGLKTALGRNQYILNWMNFIQVRKGVLGSIGNLEHGPELWGTSKLKPHESVLYCLAEFAKSKEIQPYHVLIIDDDFEFRFMAKRRFGFRVYPDDTIDEAEVKFLPHMQRMITPAF